MYLMQEVNIVVKSIVNTAITNIVQHKCDCVVAGLNTRNETKRLNNNV